MRVELSSFIDLASKGAISMSINQENATIIDSSFFKCKNEISGGAIRIDSDEGTYELKRLCGNECNTLYYDNYNDFGQFVYIMSDSGLARMFSLSADYCPSKKIATMNHGAICVTGSSNFQGFHTNSSNNYCSLGSGFFGVVLTIKVYCSFFNFANDTTFISDYRHQEYWSAFCIKEGSGEISNSNFVDCKSELSGTKTPPQTTFTNCAFFRCDSYPINLIVGSGITAELLDISFPMGCAARFPGYASQQTRENGLGLLLIATIMIESKSLL